MNWKDAPSSRFICYCKDVTKEDIIVAIANGARSLEDVMRATLACTGKNCAALNPSGTCCEKDIREMIAYYAPLAEAMHWKSTRSDKVGAPPERSAKKRPR